mgnify:CR=1 FL=1
MDITRAREVIRILADGADPATGEALPKESVYNSPDVIRALFTILEATTPKEKPQSPTRNAGKPWTEIEDDKLRDAFASKIPISKIALEHGRTYGAIESRLDHLGLRKKSFWWFWRRKQHKK